VRRSDVRCDGGAVFTSVGRRSAVRVDAGGDRSRSGGWVIRRVSDTTKPRPGLREQRAQIRSNCSNGHPVRIERVNPQYSIAAARPQDLTRLADIELAAARLLEGRAPQSILNETTDWGVLQRAQREGRLWVALLDDLAVGFAHVELLEGDAAHLEEIDVDPAHGRRGLGTRLVLQVCDWAA